MRSPSRQLALEVVAEEVAAGAARSTRAGSASLRAGMQRHVAAWPRPGSGGAGCCSPSSRPCSRRPGRSGSLVARRASPPRAAQASTTRRIAAASISARVRSCRGEKQRTRQRPVAGSATQQPVLVDRASAALAGSSAGKSLSKANVVVVGRVALRRSRARSRGRGSRRDRRRAGAPRPTVLDLALPRPLQAVGRAEDPLVEQRVVAAVRPRDHSAEYYRTRTRVRPCRRSRGEGDGSSAA